MFECRLQRDAAQQLRRGFVLSSVVLARAVPNDALIARLDTDSDFILQGLFAAASSLCGPNGAHAFDSQAR